jgi:restriction system protein
MAVGSYRQPTLRRAALRVATWELRLRYGRRAIREASGWGVASLLLLVLGLTLHVWITSVVLGGVLALAGLKWMFDQRLYELSRIGEIDSLSGREFERWLVEFFEKLGFDVELTGYVGDFGADLIVTWRGTRTAVQAKSGHFNVGVAAVQQAHAARFYYGCERAMVVSSRYFTAPALLLAEKTNVQLRSRDDLAQKVAELA